MENLKNKRNYLLDIARIVAVLAVVMIHCSASFVINYKPHTSEFVCGNLFDSIARIGVPLFIMISGSLFLDERKEITLKYVMTKKVKNLAVITIIWATIYSVVYEVIFPFLTSKSINGKSIFDGIVNGHYHMWYLYMIIGLYIITPFLKTFVCRKNKGMVLFFIIISFVSQFFTPVINASCELGLNLSSINIWIDKFHLGFFGGYITYYLVGWYITHMGIKRGWSTCIIYSLGAVALAFIILFVHYTGDYTNAYENIGAPVFVYSVALFLAINNIKINFKEKAIQIIEKLSKLTFGVYIIHVMVLSMFTKLLPYSNHCAIYIMLRFIIVVCVSFLGSYIISKIPVLKKLIRA